MVEFDLGVCVYDVEFRHLPIGKHVHVLHSTVGCLHIKPKTPPEKEDH